MAAVECAIQHNGFRFTESDIDQRRRFVALEREDLSRLAEASPIVSVRASDYVAAFFDYLRRFRETATLFARPKLVEEVKRVERDHLTAMVEGDYAVRYVEQTLGLAKLYGETGLPIGIFLGAYHYLLSMIGFDIIAHFGNDPVKAFSTFASLRKIGIFDLAIIIDVLLADRERTIARQQQAIREQTVPVLQLRQGLLLLPVIGDLDARRARQLTDSLLSAARSKRARVVVIDMTGVAVINGEVANHLVQTVEAARLIGVAVIMSGLSPAVAKTLIDFGVDIEAFDVAGDLQSGLEMSEHLLGYRVHRERTAA